ncbi:MAG: diguanylate cyclase [Candidatus Gygaella obscura]|nr:diguanylate cyclase [Candidatus Gygaella obscura]
MIKLFKKTSISSRGLRSKLAVAFALTSTIPILISVYLLTQITDISKLDSRIGVFLFLSLVIAVIGYFVLNTIVSSIIRTSKKANAYINGKTFGGMKISTDDEISDLNKAIDKLNDRIRDNMDKLSFYDKQSKLVGMDLNKKIIALSSLLQIGSFISSTNNIDDIFSLVVGKLANIESSFEVFLFLHNKSNEYTLDFASNQEKIKSNVFTLSTDSRKIVQAISSNEPLRLDVSRSESKTLERLGEIFNIRNIVIFPIFACEETKGILVVGSTKGDYIFEASDIELIRLFSRQVAISLEKNQLFTKAKKLEVKDGLTGLYNEHFIRSRLEEEIKRAFISQRPCSFVLLTVDRFQDYQQRKGQDGAESSLKHIATLLKESSREIDKPGRFGYSDFAILLPEMNKKEAIALAEEVRQKVAFIFKEEEDVKLRLTISAAVSENPIDGIKAEELIIHARNLLANKNSDNKVFR